MEFQLATAFGEAGGALPAPVTYTPGPDLEAQGITRGQRLAAVFLAVNALLVLVERALFKDLLPTSGLPFHLMAVLDLGVAGAILAGNRNAVSFAIVRGILGGLVGSIYFYSVMGLPGAVPQLMFSIGALLLLFEDAKGRRLAIGVLLLGCCLSLGLTGLYSYQTGHNPLWAVRTLMRGDLGKDAMAEVRDDGAGWRTEWPGDGWRAHDQASIKKQNPIASHWLEHPRYDAHLLFINQALPPEAAGLTGEAAEKLVMKGLRTVTKNLEVLESRSLGPQGQLMHLRMEMGSLPLEYLIGVYLSDGMMVQVHGFSHTRNFPEVSSEMERTILSYSQL